MKQPKVSLRLGAQEDIAEITAMVIASLDEDYQTYDLSVNPKKIVCSVIDYLTSPDCLVLLSEIEGEVSGVMIATTMSPFFSDDKLAAELMWWVKAEYRQTQSGKELRQAYEYWARLRGARGSILSNMKNQHSDRLDKVYPRWGYDLIERSYRKMF